MRRVTAVLSTAAMVMLTAGLFAQGKNFAGKWTADAEKTAAAMPDGMAGGGGGGGRAGGGAGGGGGDFTITMDAKTLTIERTTGKTVYNLDGSDSKNMVPGRQGGDPTEQVSKVKWDGDKLVVDTTSQGPNGPQTRTVKWYLEGANLVQETSQAPRGGGDPVVRKTYYKKAM
jgi:hypothetical protein